MVLVETYALNSQNSVKVEEYHLAQNSGALVEATETMTETVDVAEVEADMDGTTHTKQDSKAAVLLVVAATYQVELAAMAVAVNMLAAVQVEEKQAVKSREHHLQDT